MTDTVTKIDVSELSLDEIDAVCGGSYAYASVDYVNGQGNFSGSAFAGATSAAVSLAASISPTRTGIAGILYVGAGASV